MANAPQQVIPPMRDHERVLGQIERGEVLAGPEVPPCPEGRRNVKHAGVAAALKAQPGEWLPVGEYRTWGGAWNAAERIRTAYRAPAYEPAGAFEARAALSEMGARVEARYVGHRTTAEDEAWADAIAALGGGAQ